jgi:ABC-type dipeptide/oligopeptide/nickel transport system permease subunit
MAVAAPPVVQGQVAETLPRRPSPWGLALRSLFKRKLAVLAIVYIAIFYLVGIFAPVLAPYGFADQNLRNSYAPPSRQHPFGTDVDGRDVLSRVILATRTTEIVTVASAIGGGFLIPIVLGLLAGYRRGWVDSLINRTGEALGSLPPLLLMILLTATLRPRMDDWVSHYYRTPVIGSALKAGGADLALIFTVLSLIGWVGAERLIRAQVLQIRQSEYVQAAHVMGASTTRILTHHIFPNISWLVIVGIASTLGGVALAEIGLTFLGLGVRPPTPSLGAMIYDASGVRQVQAHPNLLLIPGTVAVLFLLSWILLGNALNDVLNPRRR